MEISENKSNTGLKVVVGILVLMLSGSLFYIYKISTEVETVKTVLAAKVTEKESILKGLNELKASYDAAIAENSSMADELIKEREKVVKLIREVESSKGNLSVFKVQYAKLESNMNTLIEENKGLKLQKTVLVGKLDSTSVVLNAEKKNNTVLSGQNQDLSKVVERGSKLVITNIQTSTYRLKNSGKQIATDKASSTDVIKINFTIAENKIAKAKELEYYVQIIDSENNVIGDKETVNFGNKSLKYSSIAKVSYENKTILVKEDITCNGLKKGNYFVNVFDKDELVTKTSFVLR